VAASNFPSDLMSGWICDSFRHTHVMQISAFCPMIFESIGKKNAEIVGYHEEFAVVQPPVNLAIYLENVFPFRGI
jgi:hypothetical protein